MEDPKTEGPKKEELEARLAQIDARTRTALNIIEASFNRVEDPSTGDRLVDQLKQLSKKLDKREVW